MSTLSPYGMFGFKVKRPLRDQELTHHFSTNEPASDHPHYDLSLTLLNSTFVECVDKWYAMRGMVAFAMTPFALLMCGYMGFSLYVAITAPDWPMYFVAAFAACILAFVVYAFTLDAFAYTHYPIRFNRRNRQVYVFRRNGSVFKAGWDDLYWTIYGHGVGAEDLFVAGHSLNPSDRTVKETFGLSTVTAGAAGEENLRSLFEFFRIYMESGPDQVLKALHPTPLIMLPGIHKQKESWRFGWEYLTLNLKGFPLLQVVMQVFILPMSLFRWIAMRTSKIPQWPQWVEDECHVEPDDPWVRDERHAAK
ncbi:MAG: hypothetical protein I8H76_12230 [Burkholderiales bacterium]|nr:hypothetical protein [Burkholderiales bacterium]MBH2016080.1 hypothetical protein [Burkholderiales bacterium]